MQILMLVFALIGNFFQGPVPLPLNAGSLPAAADPSVIDGSNKYLNAVLAGDVAAVVAMYREDAIVMPPGHALLQGHPAIQKFYQQLFQSPAKLTSFTFDHLESTVAGDTAYDVGSYKQTFVVPGHTIEDVGKYSVILKRTDGEWKIAYLIFNSDKPASGPLRP